MPYNITYAHFSAFADNHVKISMGLTVTISLYDRIGYLWIGCNIFPELSSAKIADYGLEIVF